MAMNDTLENLASQKIAEVPIGLGAIILACNGLSTAVFSVLDRVEDVMFKDNKPAKAMLTGINTAVGAWAAANFMDDVVGRQTANIASAAILANGVDVIAGELLKEDKKSKEVQTLTGMIRDVIAKIGIDDGKKAPGLPPDTTQVTSESTGAKKGYDYGWLPEPSSWAPSSLGFVNDVAASRMLPAARKVDFSMMA